MGWFGVVILVLISILTFLYGLFQYSFQYWKSRGIPCDEPSIPYGNAKEFGKTVYRGVFVKRLYDKYKSTGQKFCGFFYFIRPVAILIDLDLIKRVLIKDFNYFHDRGVYYNLKDDPLSAHLFALEGEHWKNLRAKLTPAFSSGKMKFMYPTVIRVAERLRNSLLNSVQQDDQVDMKEVCARYTTDVIGTCIFGLECNSLEDPDADFRRYAHKILTQPRHSILFVVLINGFKNIARKLRVKLFSDDVIAFFSKVVRNTIEYREQNDVKRNDFMDILINLKNQKTIDNEHFLTVDEITAQTFVFFMAGYETSSTAFTFSLYELALNPDIQTKARQIIRDAFKRHNGELTYEMMMDTPYIEQILEETLRKYPPSANLHRCTKQDYLVPGTDIVIEKGTHINIPVYAIQNDPEYYPNPDKFDPDRFESEERKKRDPMTWLPFGDGPRNCLAFRFGMMQDRIGLITLIDNFEFSVCPKTNIPAQFEPNCFVALPLGGAYLKVKPIK